MSNLKMKMGDNTLLKKGHVYKAFMAIKNKQIKNTFLSLRKIIKTQRTTSNKRKITQYKRNDNTCMCI